MRTVPVFMYHHINRNAGDMITLTPEDFENHLRVLKNREFRTLFLEDLVKILRGKKVSTQPSVVLTFDDGHLDNWMYAFPLLKKYGMKATIFVVTSWLGEGATRRQWDPRNQGSLPEIPRHREAKERVAAGDLSVAVNWEESRTMEASGLVDIQSHTHLHRDYFLPGERTPKLDPAKKELLAEDLARSKELIEERLGKRCRYLSWPWGKYDGEALALARNSGFEAMVTTEKGVNSPGSDVEAIKRVVAKSGDAGWFSKRLTIYSNRAVGQIYSRIAGKI
jgi:peptidoglycan/xylan/chitin deacetylase (PgdA/CDA1 family)